MNTPGNIYEKITVDGGILLIVPVMSGEYYFPLLTADDREYLKGISSPARSAQTAAWRAALRTEAGNEPISYTEAGAPVLGGGDVHIGTSHTSDTAVVVISRHRCAVDIEPDSRNFERAASRYISDEETTLPQSPHPLFKGILWCAKETMYKFSDLRELDFRRNLRITGTDFEQGTIRGQIRPDDAPTTQCPMHLLLKDGNIIVYAIAGK